MVSLPAPPQIVSLPPRPVIVSLPPRPAITSGPGVPRSASGPAVPAIVAFNPAQRAVAAGRGAAGASLAQIADTRKMRVEPMLATWTDHQLATSPDSVFAIWPVSSAGPLSSIQLSPGAVEATPPPSARSPAGHCTAAPLPAALSSTGNSFDSMVASEPAEQRANTRYGVRWSTDTIQERATSPDSVRVVSPLSSTGAETSTLKPVTTIGPVAPTPPATARVPPGQVAAPLQMLLLGSGVIVPATTVASEDAEQIA